MKNYEKYHNIIYNESFWTKLKEMCAITCWIEQHVTVLEMEDCFASQAVWVWNKVQDAINDKKIPFGNESVKIKEQQKNLLDKIFKKQWDRIKSPIHGVSYYLDPRFQLQYTEELDDAFGWLQKYVTILKNSFVPLVTFFRHLPRELHATLLEMLEEYEERGADNLYRNSDSLFVTIDGFQVNCTDMNSKDFRMDATVPWRIFIRTTRDPKRKKIAKFFVKAMRAPGGGTCIERGYSKQKLFDSPLRASQSQDMLADSTFIAWNAQYLPQSSCWGVKIGNVAPYKIVTPKSLPPIQEAPRKLPTPED